MPKRPAPTPAPHTTAAGIAERQGVQFYHMWYRKGWKRSATVGSISEFADTLPSDAHDAWMDGYLDNATGRDMWHLWECREHANTATGCMEA